MLQLAEFIYEQPVVGDVEYTFKHALTHDVAYNSLLTDRRKLLHERTGRVIETLYAERLEDHLTELAHHFDLGGNIQKAVDYLEPHRSQSRSASRAFRGYWLLYQGSRIVARVARWRSPRLPGTGSSDCTQLVSGFGPAGLRASERESALVRARELAERLGDEGKLMEPLLALAHLHFNRRQYQPARELAEKASAWPRQPRLRS